MTTIVARASALGSAVVAVALAYQAPSQAQIAGQPPGSAESSSGEASIGLQEVIVTARRREENEQNIPVAVTALSSKDLQLVSDPEALNSKVPSLSVGSTNGNRDSANFNIRGQGQAFGGSEPAVVTYFAEVPSVTAGPGTFFDLQDIQVLKGPQGTLFGRNTTGGAVLIEPVRPSTDFNGYVDLSTGNYNLAHTQAAVNLPLIGDVLMLRAAVDINRRRGFTRDAVTGVDYDNTHYNGYRVGVLWRPSESLENYTVLTASDSETHGTGTVLFSVNPTSLAAIFFPNLPLLLAEQQARGPRITSLSTPDPYSQEKNFGVTNITTWHFTEKTTLKNVLGYRRYVHRDNADIDGSAAPLVDYVRKPVYSSGSSTPPSQKAYSEELQLQGSALDHVNYVVGAYAEYIKPEADSDKDYIIELGTGPVIQQALNTDHSYAGFGQGEYDFAPWIEGLKFTAGARYTSDKREQETSQYFITPDACLLTDAPQGCRLTSAARFHATTWNTSLSYQLTPQTLTYLAARRGYKSGGFNANALLSTDRSFDPEYVRDVELGLKSDFSINGMPARLNAAAYRAIFTNIQNNAVISESPGQVQSVTRNFGNGLIWGGELEATLVPVRGMTLTASYALTEAHYTNFTVPGPAGPIDLSHLPFSNSPKGKAAITARYSTPELSWGQADLSINYTYQSRVEFLIPLAPDVGDPQLGQNGYSLLNMRADWNNVFGSLVDLGVFVNNLTDKVFKIFENPFYPTPVGITGGSYGEPRMYGIEARYRFGK